jgi:hypothetical protein
MPHYFFDTEDESAPLIDVAGRDLPDDAAARWFGLDTLPDMARDKIAEGDHRTFGVSIRNAEQVVIYAATLALMGGWKNHHRRPPKWKPRSPPAFLSPSSKRHLEGSAYSAASFTAPPALAGPSRNDSTAAWARSSPGSRCQTFMRM